MRTADGWVRWYYSQRDSGIGAPALDVAEMRGRVARKRCSRQQPARCGSTRRTISDTGSMVCAACGESWLFDEEVVLKGTIQKSVSIDALQHMPTRWMDVGGVLHRFLFDPLWRVHARCFVARAHGFTVQEIQREFPVLFPGIVNAPSERTVKRRIAEGRAEFARRLERADIGVAT